VRGITQVGATPNRVAILYDLVRATGTEGVEREALEAIATPASLTDDPEAGVDNAFRQSLSAAEDIGLIRIEGGKLLCNEDASTSFLAAVERRTISEPASIIQANGWLAGAIGWLLCQAPLAPLPFGTSAARNRLISQMGSLDFGITNDSRWQNAVYWSRALGYVERAPIGEDMVVPDPTRAISRVLGGVLTPGVQTPLRKLLADLAERSPVLDGGRLRREVENAAKISHEANEISASMALALVRLRQRGEIELVESSDADRITVDAASKLYVTHVVGKAAR